MTQLLERVERGCFLYGGWSIPRCLHFPPIQVQQFPFLSNLEIWMLLTPTRRCCQYSNPTIQSSLVGSPQAKKESLDTIVGESGEGLFPIRRLEYTKMPTLSSNSGTTISTSIKFGNLDAINSHKEMLPVFKSYNLVFISP